MRFQACRAAVLLSFLPLRFGGGVVVAVAAHGPIHYRQSWIAQVANWTS